MKMLLMLLWLEQAARDARLTSEVSSAGLTVARRSAAVARLILAWR